MAKPIGSFQAVTPVLRCCRAEQPMPPPMRPAPQPTIGTHLDRRGGGREHRHDAAKANAGDRIQVLGIGCTRG